MEIVSLQEICIACDSLILDISTTTTTTSTTTLPPKNISCGENDTHHKGNLIKSLDDIDSWQQCAHICWTTDGCTFWAFFSDTFVVSSMVGQCDLQSSDQGQREAMGVVSGTAECGECRVLMDSANIK